MRGWFVVVEQLAHDAHLNQKFKIANSNNWTNNYLLILLQIDTNTYQIRDTAFGYNQCDQILKYKVVQSSHSGFKSEHGKDN